MSVVLPEGSTGQAELGVLLRTRYDALVAECDSQLDLVKAMRRTVGAADVDDPVDSSTKSAEVEQEELLAQSLRTQLDQIAEALGLWEAGNYGNCVTCHKAIPVERLMAYPAATMCVTCKALAERHGR